MVSSYTPLSFGPRPIFSSVRWSSRISLIRKMVKDGSSLGVGSFRFDAISSLLLACGCAALFTLTLAFAFALEIQPSSSHPPSRPLPTFCMTRDPSTQFTSACRCIDSDRLGPDQVHQRVCICWLTVFGSEVSLQKTE